MRVAIVGYISPIAKNITAGRCYTWINARSVVILIAVLVVGFFVGFCPLQTIRHRVLFYQ